MNNKKIDQKTLLDKIGFDIDNNKYEESIKHLHDLCNHNPFQTQKFIEVYMQAWCSKISNMLNNKSFYEASTRIKTFYMLLPHNHSLNKLIILYFEKIKKENDLKKLIDFNSSIHLSMESYYYYQKNEYELAEKSAFKCLENLKKDLKSKLNFSENLLLIKKSLKNINDKNKAENILNQILVIIKNY